MPKTFSAPAHSRDRIRLCAPVMRAAAPCSLMMPFLYLMLCGHRPTKHPSARAGRRGATRVRGECGPSAVAPGAYKEVETHGPTVVAAVPRSEEHTSELQ